MRCRKLHEWNVEPRAAAEIQGRLREELRAEPLDEDLRFVAGADISFSKNDPRLFAAVVVLSLPELETVEAVSCVGRAEFPYVPGLLSFREVPVLLQAFAKLRHRPDALICDGHGIAHPRFLGLAAHLGILLDLPTVGCGKSLLVGEHAELPARRWSKRVLRFKGQQVGWALRTRMGVKPVFVSPGHRCDLAGAAALVRLCTGRYRLPEPTRRAHLLVNELRCRN